MNVVRDVNGNGTYEPALEVGVAGIPVTVTDPSGGSASGNTGADGSVTVALGSVTGGKYRVEASIPADKSFLKPAPAGASLSSLTEFADVSGGKNVTLTMGVWNPSDYCQSSPELVTACQRNGVAPGADASARSLVGFPFTSRGTTAATQKANQGATGTVFGLAFRKQDKRIFSGAFAKRLAAYGPGGAGGIYVTTAAGATSRFATVPAAGGTAHQMNRDADGPFFGVPGTESLGDLDVSEDGSELYVVNMADKKLYVYDATQATASAPKGSYAIPNPACAAAADWRPGALGVRDGKVYVGGVCSAATGKRAADLKAAVFTFSDGAFSAAPVLTKALNFRKGGANNRAESQFWQPWSNTWADMEVNNKFNVWPMPLLTDIGIEADGDLVLSFRDRFGDMTGHEMPAPDGSGGEHDGMAGGDLNRACLQANGSYAWEGTGNCPNNHSGANGGRGEPAEVVEYYPGEFWENSEATAGHWETSQGALAVLYGETRMPAVVMDPRTVRTGGVGFFDRTNGTMQNAEHSNSYEIASDRTEGWGKANGLGDLEALCELAPVQIGNRAWFDTDADGVQDGDEPALPGVRVQLLACGSTTVLATKTTDAKGQYYFGAAEGVKPGGCYTLKFDYSSANTSGVPGAPPPASLRWTGKEAGASRTVDSNVDPANGTAAVTVGAAGADDHSIDAGVTVTPPNKLGDYVWVDANRNGVQDAGEAGVPGVKVTAKKADGSTAGTATTDANGKYLITPLADGAYTVCFDLSGMPAQYAGYLLTRPNTGADGADSDPDPATGCTASTTLGPDKREDLTLDAGIRPPNSLGDYVWIDTNKNGLQDAPETGVPGVTVTVQKEDGTPAGAPVQTDSTGKYLFDKLPDGKYKVCFDLENLPATVADYQLTTPNSGDDGKDSDADPATGCTPVVELNVDNPQNLTLDAGLVPPVNRIGDYVWIDSNKNGLQDAPETGVPGVKVTLLTGSGTEVTSTSTDENGKYLFSDLPDGSYQVCFGITALPTPVADHLLTTANAGDDAKDSDADPVTGCTPVVELGPGKRENLTLDAGLVSPPNRLGDYVWVDANKNGLQDDAEQPVPGVTVVLKDGNGAEVRRTTTDATGKYLFGDLPDGKFSVCFDLKNLPATVADYQVTKPLAGDPAKDSDADPATGCTPAVDLGPGKRENLTLDAGLVPPANRVGDYVWIDGNRNGVQDDGEQPVADVPVVLKNGNGAEVATAKTDPQGKYLFDNLPDGTYQVCFQVKALPAPVADYTLTTANSGSDDAKDSDADPVTGCTEPVQLGPGKRENLTLDAGLVSPPNKLGDYVWVDANKNGLQDDGETPVPGVTVVLKDGNGAELKSTTTDAQGKYLFGDLPDGKYSVCFGIKNLPAAYGDYQVTKPLAGDPAKDSDADPATGCTPVVELGSGKRENLTLDAGITSPVNRLGDYVWIDADKNGLQDAGETPVPDVPVVLKNGNGAEVATSKTDAQGKYLFDNLPDGTYQVCFGVKALPAKVADYTLTTANAGDDTKDSDADPVTGCTASTMLGTGKREDLTLDAGLVAPPNRLGDHVWVDTNRNGLQDPGEPGVPGVPVKVLDSGGKPVGETKTDEQGKYRFENLPDGTYQVCFDLKTLPAANAGYLPATANAGSEDGRDSDADPASGCTEPVTLGPGKRENLTLDAGIRPPNRLGDYVWVDANRNGVQDDGEKPVPGVTAVLKDGSGKQLATTKTDAQGKYLFDELPDGTYQVCFDGKSLPAPYADFQVTKPNAGEDGKDSDVDPASWCTPVSKLGADRPEDLTLDAGIAAPVNRLGDYVWVDSNGNGLQDPDEPGVEGVPVKVVDKDGRTVTETSTGKDGKYLVEGLPDGTYTVCFGLRSLPSRLAGYLPTKAGAGDQAKDSDADPATGCTKPVALGAGNRENLNLDAGLLAPKPAPGPGPKPVDPVTEDPDLADTGADVGWLLALGLLALGGGTGLMLLANRRRRSSDGV